MVKRQCYKCNAIFNQKGHYENHINRKFDCSPISVQNAEINEEKNVPEDKLNENCAVLCSFVQDSCGFVQSQSTNIHKDIFMSSNPTKGNELSIETNDSTIDETNNKSSVFSCSYCNKKYSSKSTLTRHLKDNCNAKKETEIEKENIFKLLLEKDKQKEIEINELKKQNKLFEEQNKKFEKQNKLLMDKIDKLINLNENSKASNITNSNNLTNSNNNLTNSNNNIQNNFVMVIFGKEDLSIIDEKLFIDRIIKKNTISGVKIPDEVLKIIHFNPMYPQLSNIYISDINREKCMVWEDGEWILSNIDNIPQIMDKICIFSSEQINMLREKFPNSKALNDRLNVIEKYNNMINDDYIQDLREDDDYNANKSLIKRAEDFQKLAYNTIKKTLYNEGKKLKKTIKQN